MKKILLLSLISISFSQYWGGNISIGGSFPRGEFEDKEVPPSIALGINALT